jgi:hypothetical protein
VVEFISYWYYHIPNYMLAVIQYSLIGRVLLGVMLPWSRGTYISRAFEKVSDLIVVPTRFITPSAAAPPVVIGFAFLWILLIRVVFFVEMTRFGLTPPVTP